MLGIIWVAIFFGTIVLVYPSSNAETESSSSNAETGSLVYPTMQSPYPSSIAELYRAAYSPENRRFAIFSPEENLVVQSENRQFAVFSLQENRVLWEINLAKPSFYQPFIDGGYVLIYEQNVTDEIKYYTTDGNLYKTYTVASNGIPYLPWWVEEIVVGENLETFILSLQEAGYMRRLFYFDRELGQRWDTSFEEYPMDMALSPDGEFLLYVGSTKVYCISKDGTTLWSDNLGLFRAEAVDTNGKYVVATTHRDPKKGEPGETHLFDNNGNLLWETQIPGDWVFMGPDGWFASVDRSSGGLYLFRPDTNQPVWSFEAPETAHYTIMSDEDNIFLATSNHIYLFNKTDNVPIYSTTGFFSQLSISTDGKFFSGLKENQLFIFRSELEFPENPNDSNTSIVSEGSIALKWFRDPSADRYVLQLSQSQSFETENIVTDNHVTTELEAGTYYWRVKSIAPDGTESSWSEIQTLIVEPPKIIP